MSEEQLFDWELPEKRKRTAKQPVEEVPYDPAWKLLGRRNLVIGFHFPQSINDLGSVVAMCGEVGRSVSVGDNLSRMVKCPNCVKAIEDERRESQLPFT